jgi:DNA adenine methylase
MKAPFPWFGGKSRVSGLVWDRFGDVPNYVEPFFGSGAILLNRPTDPGIETINDLDCMVANFWRALQNDPDGVAEAADRPVNEADQHAIHLWLVSQEEFRERMKTEIDFYDSTIAGRWVWGQCIWIGSGWCSVQLPHLGNAGKGVHRKRPHLGAAKGVHRKLPHLGDAGKGVNRQLPHLGNAGTGVHRKLPHLGNAGKGVNRQLPHLGDAGKGVECVSDPTSGTPTGLAMREYLRELAERLRKVRVCCGDWSRICGPSPTVKLGTTGVFLDPPYADEAGRQDGLYATDSGTVAHQVREWALEWGNDPRMRIALCGYEGEHKMPSAWEEIAWKARGGYGSQGDSNGSGRLNSKKETIWFSPHCLRPQGNLFHRMDDTELAVLGEQDQCLEMALETEESL